MKRGIVILTIVLLILCALVGTAVLKYGPNFGIYILPQTPVQYGEQALTFMDNGMYSDSAEWAQCRSEAEAAIRSAKSIEDCYEILENCAKVAGGKHSRFIPPAPKGEVTAAVMPSFELNDGILVLTVPEFSGTKDEGQKYAEILSSAIRENRDVRGYVIDLRGNTGGDMGYMVSGLSPLLPDGELMYFDVRGIRSAVKIENGAVTGGGSACAAAEFKTAGLPIAILTDDMTASSGEATLICFLGLENVRSFGTPTAGYASSNTVMKMSDNAHILITIGTDVSRSGDIYCDDPIIPDVETANALESALNWILNY